MSSSDEIGLSHLLRGGERVFRWWWQFRQGRVRQLRVVFALDWDSLVALVTWSPLTRSCPGAKFSCLIVMLNQATGIPCKLN